jgi:hypothetical protein
MAKEAADESYEHDRLSCEETEIRGKAELVEFRKGVSGRDEGPEKGSARGRTQAQNPRQFRTPKRFRSRSGWDREGWETWWRSR